MVMEVLLKKIIKECEARGIKVEFNEKNEHYHLKNLIKHDLELYTTEDAVILENNYKEIEHVLSFKDVVHATHFWRNTYKDSKDWIEISPEWDLVYKEYLGSSDLTKMMVAVNEDLPF